MVDDAVRATLTEHWLRTHPTAPTETELQALVAHMSQAEVDVLRRGGHDLRKLHAAFAQAREQQRFVLLYLEAVWCHWCHVMDHQTYADPAVRALVDAHYVPLRIDQDARPDLANRYRDYGWPATIVLAADGTEIVKRRGYIPAANFARLLQAIIDDPSPERGDRRDAAPGGPRRGGSLMPIVFSASVRVRPRHAGLPRTKPDTRAAGVRS